MLQRMKLYVGGARSVVARFSGRLQQNDLLAPLLIFVITRGLLLLVAYLGRIVFLEAIGPGPYHAAPHNLFLDIWDRWDSSYYRGIARAGYVYGEGDPGNVAFFPVYPLLLAAASRLVEDPVLAGVVVSHICLLLAFILLYRLVLLEFGSEGTAQRTLYYIALFPTSFFFSAVYSESAFLLFSVAAVYALRRRYWLRGGLLGAIAAATRPTGILLFGFALLEWGRAWWQTRTAGVGETEETVSWHALAAISLIPLGLGAYMWHLWSRFGDPFAFVNAHAYWGRGHRVFPLSPLWRDFSGTFRLGLWQDNPEMWRVALDSSAGILFLLLTYWIWRHLGLPYAAYTLAALLLPLSTGSTMSLLRFLLVLFPAYMVLGFWGRHPFVDRALIIGFSLLLAVLTTVFVNWGFVG